MKQTEDVEAARGTARPVREDITSHFGLLPNFFKLAEDVPGITDNLWGFAKFAYIDNPLPPIFKERLFVYLSRFCDVRYCISRHVGFLLGLGNPSGDPNASPETVERVVQLLQRPLPRDKNLDVHLARLEAAANPPASDLLFDDTLEDSVFACVTHVFLQTRDAERSLETLQKIFSNSTFKYLLVFVAFVRTAHFWTIIHPQLSREKDIDELLAVQTQLTNCLVQDPLSETATTEILVEELASLREERKMRRDVEHANVALDAERELLQVTLASIGDAVISTDATGRIIFLNPVAEELTEWRSAEATGRPLEDVFSIFSEKTRMPAASPVRRALEKGEVAVPNVQSLLITRSGREYPIDESAAPIQDAAGNNIGSVLVFRDMTERREWESKNNERLKSAQLLASIVHSSQDAIISKSLNGIIESWNPAAERMFGYKAAEAIGSHVSLIIPKHLEDEERQIIARVSAGELFEHFDAVRRHKDGREISVSLTVSPLKNSRGIIVGASSILRDISERKRMENRLRQVASELSDADQRKDEFLATLAHELRNPLAPLRTGLEIMRSGSSDALSVERAREMLERQVRQMARLVDDLMDVSRISRGVIKIQKSIVELAPIVRNALETTRPIMDEMDHELIIDLPAEPIHLEADSARMSQVLSNLLNNAAKYSPKGSRIWLDARSNGEFFEITVRDTGVGIAAENLPRIFDMFAQVDASVDKAQGGLGIGLTLAHSLVQLHDGQLSVDSKGPGKGAEFVTKLPVASGIAVTAKSVDNVDALHTGAALRIAIIDDNSDAADALVMLLSHKGHDVKAAYDGWQGLKLAEDMRPDVLLLDIGLPGIDGYEVCRKIKAEEWGSRCTVIAVTGWGAEQDRQNSRDAGADFHFVKPMDPQRLLKLLTELRSAETG